MAFALVNSATQTADNFTGDATAVLTVSSTTVGNLIVVVVNYGTTSRTVNSVTGGATYTSLHRKVDDGGGESRVIEIFAGICTSAATSITVVLSGNDTFGDNSRTTALEFSGAADPLAESGTSVDNYVASGATGVSLGSVSCDTADTLFIAASHISGSHGTWTEDTDFTNYVDASLHKVAYRIQNGSSTAQSYTTSWDGTARGYIAAMVGIQGGAAALDPIRLVWRQ